MHMFLLCTVCIIDFCYFDVPFKGSLLGSAPLLEAILLHLRSLQINFIELNSASHLTLPAH